MSVLDIGVIVVTIIFLVRGAWIGFFRQLAFFAALFMGYAVAGIYYTQLSQHVQWINDPQLRFVVTYAVLFIVTYVFVILLGFGLKKVMQISFMGWFDRMLGGIFGLAKAVFISTLAYMALAAVLTSSSPIIHKSFCSKYLLQSSHIITAIIRDKNLQAQLVPQKPAISSFLTEHVPALKSVGRESK